LLVTGSERYEQSTLTVKGAENLRAELHHLKTVERPNVIAAIAEARSHGDLSENAEYDAAKERQGFVEGRIKEVEASCQRPDHRPEAARCRRALRFWRNVDLEDQDSGDPGVLPDRRRGRGRHQGGKISSIRRSPGR
jgi:transcription elongation factor GreA